ncbi:DUF2971 domain-containing protein [Pectobacterium versatile]|uniref:DUF2971 domain-containing protein n=1 Tax=Pectobacterium versatile TaxID=2488639 RepID=UPI001935CCAA|nr:DUF2971 domain-containing protein [Pectobacterium versatile]QQK71981.1 DUF2971 domain-containing protein [Pectobacterium versatile]
MKNDKKKSTEENDFTYCKYMPLDTLDKILMNGTLRMSSHDSFNDPFDCNFAGYTHKAKLASIIIPLLEKEIPDLRSNYVKSFNPIRNLITINDESEFKDLILTSLEEVRNGWDDYLSNYRVLCLTKKKDNILLWSHYAEHHKGAVLCFNFEKDRFFSNIKKVAYPEIDDSVSKTVMGSLNEMVRFVVKDKKRDLNDSLDFLSGLLDKKRFSEVIVNYFLKDFSRFFFIKKIEWAYENEYRLVVPKKDDGPLDIEFKKEYLKEVNLGVKFPEDKKEFFIERVSEKFPAAKIFTASKYNSEIKFSPIVK